LIEVLHPRAKLVDLVDALRRKRRHGTLESSCAAHVEAAAVPGDSVLHSLELTL
jgi:hypothetical protein